MKAELFWNDGARLDIAYTVTGSDGTVRATGFTVQMFWGLKSREAFFFPPDVVTAMRERWTSGELHD